MFCALFVLLCTGVVVSEAATVCCVRSDFDVVADPNELNVEINEFRFTVREDVCKGIEVPVPGPCTDIDLCDYCEDDWSVLRRLSAFSTARFCVNTDALSVLSEADLLIAYGEVLVTVDPLGQPPEFIIPAATLFQGVLQCDPTEGTFEAFEALVFGGLLPPRDIPYCVSCATPETLPGDPAESCRCGEVCFGRGTLEEFVPRGRPGDNVVICHVPPGNTANPQTLQFTEASAVYHLARHSHDREQPCCVCEEGFDPGTYCEMPL